MKTFLLCHSCECLNLCSLSKVPVFVFRFYLLTLAAANELPTHVSQGGRKRRVEKQSVCGCLKGMRGREWGRTIAFRKNACPPFLPFVGPAER